MLTLRHLLLLISTSLLFSFASTGPLNGQAKRFNETPKLFVNSGVANVASRKINEIYKEFYIWYNDCSKIRELDRSTHRRISRLLNRGTLYITPSDWYDYIRTSPGSTDVVPAPWAIYRGPDDVDVEKEVPLMMSQELYGEEYIVGTFRYELFESDWRGFFTLQSAYIKLGPEFFTPQFSNYANENHQFLDLILFALNRHQDSREFQNTIFEHCP